MKKNHLTIIIIIFLCIFAAISIKKLTNERDTTRNYSRLSDTSISKRFSRESSARLTQDKCQHVNLSGLKEMNVHASGLINYHDFKSRFKGQMNKVYVMNLIAEDLYYFKDRPLRWYGWGYTFPSLGKDLTKDLHHYLEKMVVRFIYGSPPIHDINQLQTEGQILKELGAHYSMPFKNRPGWLTDFTYIDDVVSFFKDLPDDGILYIHCLGGRGRTTTFLVLYDIFKNAKKVPLDDIVTRHYCLGREDLFDITVWDSASWTVDALAARKKLIERFYTYMTTADGYPSQTWSQWSKQQNFDNNQIKVHLKSESVNTHRE